jgi:hypothetical protein
MAAPAKVLDDEASVPVLTLDAAARLESLKAWLEVSGYIAVAGWLAIAAMTFWERRAKRVPMMSTGQAADRPVQYPAQRLLIGLIAFAVGGFLTYNAAAIGTPGDDDVKSVEVMAQITAVSGPPYKVQLGWNDGQGGVHHFGPLPISESFWSKITRDGNLEVHETKVRVHLDDAMGRPEILEDAPGTRWQTHAVLACGIVLLLIGAGCLLTAARKMRRS